MVKIIFTKKFDTYFSFNLMRFKGPWFLFVLFSNKMFLFFFLFLFFFSFFYVVLRCFLLYFLRTLERLLRRYFL